MMILPQTQICAADSCTEGYGVSEDNGASSD
jgi:hypothetical protein